MPKQKSSVPVVSGAVVAQHRKLDHPMSSSQFGVPMQSYDMDPAMVQMASQPKTKAKVSSGDHSLVGYAAMMADPLNAQPYAKPDDSTYQTNVAKLKDVYDVSPDSAGNAVMLFSAGPYLSNYIAPTVTAGAVTSFGSGVSSQWYNTLNTDNGEFRTLIYVVEWKPSMPVNTASGSIFIGAYPCNAAGNVSGVPVQALSAFFDDAGVSGPAAKPAVGVGRPLQQLGFNILTNTQSAAFPSIAVVFSGLPATNIAGKIHVTRIYELVPLGGTLPALTAKFSPCDMTACCVAANIQGIDAMGAAGHDRPYGEVTKRAATILKAALSMYGGYSSGGATNLLKLFGW